LVSYQGEVVCSLDMDFLHHGWPQRAKQVAWQAPVFAEPDLPSSANWEEIYRQVMAHGNVCSKEPIVRMYDHGVQGTCALPPFGGVNGDAPNDAVILTPFLDQPYAVIISHGLNPVLNKINPYYGSLWAIAEAAANAIAVGANPRELMLIDNFIWPVPEENFLGAIDLAVDACVDFARATGMPFISGKDSLSSTYRGKDNLVIHIPPVLCVSAFGRLPDVTKTVSADFKKEHSQVVLVGCRNPMEMAGSVYYDLIGYIGNNLPKIDLAVLPKVYQAVYQAIAEGKVLACHDISEGGLAAALAEMCFGGNLGAVINIPAEEKAENFLFNETAGCFLIELDPKINPANLFAGVPHKVIGHTVSQREITAYRQKKLLFALPLAPLKEAWQRPMKEVFGGSITA
jgi:phosphoribosylformylglycinamidine synthase